jgi:hypothetical protein
MSDIFYEVKEAVQKERLEKIWKIIKLPIVFICISIIVGSGIYSYMEKRDYNRSCEDQSVYFLILDYMNQGDTIRCLEKIDYLIENGSEGYVQLALLMKASINSKIGNKNEVKLIYKNLSDRYKNFSDMFTYISVINGSDDENSFKKIIEISESSKVTYLSNACLELALINEITSENKKSEAEKMINALKDNRFTRYTIMILLANAAMVKVE